MCPLKYSHEPEAEIICYSQQAGGISPWHCGPQRRGDPQLQKTKQWSYKAVPSGGLLHCPTFNRAGKAETIPSIPSPMEWCWKSHSKTKTESGKCQPAWGRHVHLLCWLGLADQSCVEEGMMCCWKQSCKSLEKPTCKSNTSAGLLMRICVLYSPQKKAGISWSRPSRHCAEAYQNEFYVGAHMVYLPMPSTGALRDWSQGLFKHVLV